MEAHVADASWTNEAWEEGKRGRQYAIFREEEVEDKHESAKAGRPIFKTRILIEKLVPGDPLNRPVRPMRERDKEEFPQEWARFQQKQTQQTPGTPLSAVTWLSRTQIAEFNALQIQTVEQLATLPDSVANRIMGFHDVRRKAEAYLKASQDSAFTAKLEGELKERDKQIEALAAQVAALTAAVDAKGGKVKAL